jgi:hypothetical protein
MFKELIRELKRLQGTHQIPISVPTDAEGYLDRQCPSSECRFEFKIHEADWKEKVSDQEVFCAFCGHKDNSTKWSTAEQIEYFTKEAINHLNSRLGRAMKLDANDWNCRQPKNSFIRITMTVNNVPKEILVPPQAADPMRLRIACPVCSCRYAVIGAAFFCPACGHNAADLMFTQAILGIRNVLESLPAVRTAIPDQDIAENTVRLIVENGLQNAVTAFQRYAEALYSRFASAMPPRRNAFQNLKEGSDLWHAASGKHYTDYLTSTEAVTLARLFQQRHLLAHTQGIVDTDYITRTADSSYRVGQRLVIRKDAVRECLLLIEKLTLGMRGP